MIAAGKKKTTFAFFPLSCYKGEQTAVHCLRLISFFKPDFLVPNSSFCTL